MQMDLTIEEARMIEDHRCKERRCGAFAALSNFAEHLRNRAKELDHDQIAADIYREIASEANNFVAPDSSERNAILDEAAQIAREFDPTIIDWQGPKTKWQASRATACAISDQILSKKV